MKTKGSKMGRPQFPKGMAKSVKLCVRVKPGVQEALSEAARQRGVTVSAYVSEVLEAAVTEKGNKHGVDM